MIREEIFKKLIPILAEDSDTSDDMIDEETELFEGLEYDQITLYEITLDIEEIFDVNIPEEVIDSWRIISDIINTLQILTE